MRRSINWRFVTIGIGILGAGLISLHLVHRWQVRKQVGAYLRLADEARDEKNVERETQYLERYIASRPDASDQRERLARLLATSARGSKAVQNAYLALEDVLRRDPSRAELRWYTVEYALTPRNGAVSVEMASAAKSHLIELMKARPNDGELEERLAFCLTLEREFAQAAAWYQKAYTHKPDLIDAYTGHARLLRTHLSDPITADQVMAGLVANNGTSTRAHLIHADYLTQYGYPDQAMAAVDAARQLAPDEPEVILAAAAVAVQQARTETDPAKADPRLADARSVLDRGRRRYPNLPLMYVRRAELGANLADALEVLREGLTANPNDPTLLAALFECQFRAGEVTAADTLKALEAAGLSPDGLAYARARMRMLRGEWRAAASELERIRATANNPSLVREISLHIGRCYTKLDEPDRRLQAFARATPDDRTDPNWVQATIGQADAYAELGRSADALRLYESVAESNREPRAWLVVAKYRLLKVARTPDPTRRDWKPAEEAIGRAEKYFPESTECRLLRADLLVLTGQTEAGDRIVDELFAARSKEPIVWIAKAAQEYRRKRTPDTAIRVLEQGRRELSDPVRLRLEQARYASDPNTPEVAKILSNLADKSDAYPPDDRLKLFRTLAATAEAVGLTDVADRLWDRVLAMSRDDLSVHLVRFERAWSGTDADALERALSEVRRVDGETGPSTRFTRAMGLVWHAVKNGDRSGLTEAFNLFEGLERDRPDWPQLSVGKARVRDLEGQTDAALALYQQAVDRGEDDPHVLRRLHALLVQKGRYTDANDLLTKLPAATTDDPAIRRLAAETSLLANDSRRALELATRAVAENSNSSADLIWLAQLRRAAGDPEGAEKTYRRAVELKPQEAYGWYLLLEHLIATGRSSEAANTLDRAKAAVRPESVALLSARYRALTGELERARVEFEKARLARPGDRNVLLAEADFLTAAQMWPAAREAWERVITLPGVSVEDKQFGAQALAVCLAMDPDYTVSRRALDQLQKLSESGVPDTPAWRRARAIVLSLQKDRASKLAAIQLLQADHSTLTPSDRFTLAQLYNQVGDRTSFRAEMTELLRSADRIPLYTAFFADWLLNRNEVREAEPLVAKLAELRPNSLWTVELRARTRAARNDQTGAKAVLREAETQPDPPYGQLARVAEKVGLPTEAEAYHKKAVARLRAQTPEVQLDLAMFYARQGRQADAMSVLESAWNTCPPAKVGQACVEALMMAPTADINTLRQVAGWIDTARTADPKASPALLYQLAVVRNIEGNYDAAIDLFRRSMAGNRPDPQSLNNLAYLLSAYQGKHDEALALLDQAKRMAGPVPNLLDTEAQVRTARGTREDLTVARALLQDVIALTSSGVAYFHLSVLETKLGNRAEAEAAWAEAQRRKLKSADLHPLEGPAYRKMANRSD